MQTECKDTLRKEAHARRNRVRNAELLSEPIRKRLMLLPACPPDSLTGRASSQLVSGDSQLACTSKGSFSPDLTPTLHWL